eukprot:CAMPEP_0173186320 /NCGR_PEP_ID=MMETSP1141-20130122/10071_1 /TAXON_ID=483371 /ORGANISM="non described non described, Strain CCMP2298" /LENGTH=164 /DNA_ID=CAMNT_0014109999 /DNA_START=812 /DNA_END=1306 /DNA_ORIENTATION=+
MSLPALIAATVGSRPAQPTMPVTTVHASVCVATARMPSSPAANSGKFPGSIPMSRSFALSSSNLFESWMDTSLGLNSTICCARRSRFDPAAIATHLKNSGFSLQMSSVCVPILPVLPSRDSFLLIPAAARALSMVSFNASVVSTGAAWAFSHRPDALAVRGTNW